MRIHPLMQDPAAVLIARAPVSNTPSPADFAAAARRILSALQLRLEGERVVIKPNVTAGEHYADPETGIGTHPAFVRGMIEYLQTQGATPRRMAIVEDPRNTDDNAPRHWRGTGYDTLSAETGVPLRCPTSHSCVRRAAPQPLAMETLNVSRLAVAPRTLLINAPKMKTHNLGITTLCLKNLMGLVNAPERHFCRWSWLELPEPARSEVRPREEWLDRETHERWQMGLARRLADTAQIIRPALNLVEGVIAREGTGFQRGRNRALGLVIAGVNMVAVDAVASYLMGFDPRELIYLQVAAQAGLGVNDLGRLRVYEEREGEVIPCADLDRFRADPPFVVISNIVGENPGLFQQDGWPVK